MKQRLIDYFAKIAHSNWVFVALFFFSLLESIIIPIPLEVVLIPLMLHSSNKRVWALASTALLGFLAGATIGYLSAMHLFDSLAAWWLQNPEAQQHYQMALEQMQQHGFWYLLTVGLTPIPSQIAMLAGGSTGFSFVLFFIAMFISRSIRYFSIAWLMNAFGESGYQWLKTHKSLAKRIFALLVLLAILYELLD